MDNIPHEVDIKQHCIKTLRQLYIYFIIVMIISVKKQIE